MKNFVLLDGFAMMFRSYYAVRFAPQYKDLNVNAVYGCATTIMQALEQFQPDKILVAFDAPEKTFRHELDPDYKAQRTAAPDEFLAQIVLVKALIEAFDIPQFVMPGFEADDIIGTFAVQAEGFHSYIMSGDLDFLQLVNDRITLARFNGKGPELFDKKATIEKLGVPPEQVIDYKALCGDSSDNYKGLPGMGPKGAVKLLETYADIGAVYQQLDQLPDALRAKLSDNEAYLKHCQHLATIKTDVPLQTKPADLPDYRLPQTKVASFYEKLGFNKLQQRLSKLTEKNDQPTNIEHNNSSNKPDQSSQMNLF